MKYFAILFLMLVFPTANSQESKASGKIVPFKLVEQPPVFKGCEDEDRDCTLRKITNFFVMEFNRKVLPDNLEETDLAIKIILDEAGSLAWQRIATDSPEVEAEAIRSLKKLPPLTPAKHNETAVGVMIDFAVKLNLFETPPYPEECKNEENKKECLSEFTTSYLFKNFNRLNLKGKGMLYAELSFFINSEGKISGLKVSGQNEVFNQALLAAMKNFPPLYPATRAGEKAPYPLKMPVYYGKN